MSAALRTYMKASPNPSPATAHTGLSPQRNGVRAGSYGIAAESEEGQRSSLSLHRATRPAEVEPAKSYGVPPIVHETLRSSVLPLDAPAYTGGREAAAGAGQYAPDMPRSRRLRAAEFTPAAQQIAGKQMGQLLQRQPIFSDTSCDGGQIKEKIERNVGIATELVRHAVSALENPEAVAGPLRRFFSIDVDKPGHAAVLASEVKRNLVKIQKKLEGPVETRCASPRDEPDLRGVRGQAEMDAVAGTAGIAYNRNVFSLLGFTTRTQVVNTIIHEYAHLVGVGHGEMHGEPISNENSTKVRGLSEFQAMNNAESYMRFVRAVN